MDRTKRFKGDVSLRDILKNKLFMIINIIIIGWFAYSLIRILNDPYRMINDYNPFDKINNYLGLSLILIIGSLWIVLSVYNKFFIVEINENQTIVRGGDYRSSLILSKTPKKENSFFVTRLDNEHILENIHASKHPKELILEIGYNFNIDNIKKIEKLLFKDDNILFSEKDFVTNSRNVICIYFKNALTPDFPKNMESYGPLTKLYLSINDSDKFIRFVQESRYYRES